MTSATPNVPAVHSNVPTNSQYQHSINQTSGVEPSLDRRLFRQTNFVEIIALDF